MNEYQLLAERLIKLKQRGDAMRRVLLELREMFVFDGEGKWADVIMKIDEALNA